MMQTRKKITQASQTGDLRLPISLFFVSCSLNEGWGYACTQQAQMDLKHFHD